jgi:hypothetical protein
MHDAKYTAAIAAPWNSQSHNNVSTLHKNSYAAAQLVRDFRRIPFRKISQVQRCATPKHIVHAYSRFTYVPHLSTSVECMHTCAIPISVPVLNACTEHAPVTRSARVQRLHGSNSRCRTDQKARSLPL